MHDLASYAMRGPRQAAVLATVTAAVPLMYWLAAAIVALVVLRFGLARGLSVAVWPMLPAMAWMALAGDPSALLSIPAVLLMAGVLRMQASWPAGFLVGGLFFGLTALLTPMLMPGFHAFLLEFSDALLKAMQDAGTLAVQAEPEVLKAAFDVLMLACFVGGLFGMTIMSLFLARA